jgi:hypothetical protein
MHETVMMAEAIACLMWAFCAGAILHYHRHAHIGVALRISLSVIAVSGVILGGTRLAVGLDMASLSVEWVRFARVAGPLAAVVAMAAMHRRMLR